LATAYAVLKRYVILSFSSSVSFVKALYMCFS